MLISRWLFVLAAIVFFAVSAIAQEKPSESTTGKDAERLLQQAEAILKEESSSETAFAEIRSQIAKLRDASSELVKRGSVEARALQAQIDSLGPPPAKDKTEPSDIAKRRKELQEALATANKPIRAAQETLKRAELLITELDAAIRKKGAQILLKHYPSPLLPSHWLTAGKDLASYAALLWRQSSTKLEARRSAPRMSGELPTVIILIVFGLTIIVFVQPLVLRRLERPEALRRAPFPRWAVLAFANLMRLILPAIGAAALILAFRLIDLTPLSAQTLVTVLPVVAAFIICAHWLGHTLFAPTGVSYRLLPLKDSDAWRAVRLCQGLGVVLAAEFALEALRRDYSFNEATLSVVSFPILLAAAFFLWWLALLFRAKNRDVANGDAEHAAKQSDSGILTILSALMRISAVFAAGAILLGFVNLSRKAINPMIFTIAELGFALFLYRVITIGIHALVSREEKRETTGLLLSVSIVCILALLVGPLLALTWGARITDLVEVWRLLTNGVQIGEFRISLDVVVTLIVVFTIGVFITRWLQRLLRASVFPRTQLDIGARTAIDTGVGYLGLTLAAIIAVGSAGVNLSSLAVVVGALSVGIGFGLQAIVSNFVSGIILLIERPIKEGDWIEVAGYSGLVRKIAVRATRIETFDRHDVVIPNSNIIAGSVVNMTLSSQSGRLTIPVGVAYGSNLETTRNILLEAAKAHSAVLPDPEPAVLFMGFGDNSLNFELRCFLRNIGTILATRSDLLFNIYHALEKAGIQIPFPQRDIHLSDIDRLVAAIADKRSDPHKKE